MLWAMKNAPVIDAEERGVLMALAESAWSDGTDAFPSKKTIAHIAVVDPKTVQRRLRTLTARGLIAEGNQKAAAYIPSWCRPKVYDLLIPYSWYPDVEQVNAERRGRGKPPLTRESRPDLAPAPPRKTRADKGKPRKKKPSQPEGRGLKVPSVDNQDGGTTSPQAGDCKSPTRGLQDPQPSPDYPPQDTPRPSVPAPDAQCTENRRTDGESASELSPGVQLLLSIGARKPQFLLTGRTLTDQGLMVTGMLLEGWTPGHSEQVITGRPLPQPVKATVGAIIARRLRDANASPAPATVPFPNQTDQGGGARTAPETLNGGEWLDQSTVDTYREMNECDGQDGRCGRPRRPGSTLCWECSSVFGAAAFTELHDEAG